MRFFVTTMLICALGAGATQARAQAVPAVPVPAENPITEQKRVLGKILFWDEQLSSDNSVACGTCHAPEGAGADLRTGTHPGADGTLGNADDVTGSPGVVRRNGSGVQVSDPVFGFAPQVTGRSAPNFFGGLWAARNFWDGRAGSAFMDPNDGTTVLIPAGGALENQAVGPILSSVEMAKDGRTWSDVVTKLAAATPLQFASDLPADVTAAIAGASYGDLFNDAFGDSSITPGRIGFAIATYERTLVADQTPWDAFVAGNPAALTPAQTNGWNFFQTSDCNVCHVPPLFTDNSFRNIGVRDPNQDLGRALVTGLPADDGRFKVPTLRNVGLKEVFFHTGEVTTLTDAVTFYGVGNQGSQINIDPLMPTNVPGPVLPDLVDFIDNGLRDPRVEAASFPFDRPTLTAAGAGTPVPLLPGVTLLGLIAGLLVLSAWPRSRLRDSRARSPRASAR